MHTNVVDIIVYMMKEIRLGKRPGDIPVDQLNKYKKAEVSAAFSWIMQRYETGDMAPLSTPDSTPHRILHFAERLVISPDAYGYMLELVNLGLIDFLTMEKIIEKVMLNSSERITIEKMKEIVSTLIFEGDSKSGPGSPILRGNESIN